MELTRYKTARMRRTRSRATRPGTAPGATTLATTLGAERFVLLYAALLYGGGLVAFVLDYI
ncbi:MAG: hypothetical protein ICV64_00510 [Thermoleophilia bacterium]|nr:hypothetical protein [Thermoleophilia bacterium]